MKRLLLICFLATALPLLAAGNASKVNQALVQIREGKANGRIELTEADLNAWVQVAVASKERLGVKKVEVDLRGMNRVRATALVNMDDVKLEGFTFRVFRTLLSGEQTLVTDGKLQITNRKATYEVESASMNGVTVPAWLASSVISYLSSKQPPHVDVTEPFDLPYGIRDVQLLQDRAVILR